MILAVRDRVAQMVAQGKTQDEVLAAHPTADYDARIPNSKETTERFVTQVYAELKAAK
jgi:cyclase